MKHTYTDDHQADIDYVHAMVDTNPAWVPWLASLFRSGRMARLVDMAEDEGEEDDKGKKISVRVKRVTKTGKTSMLAALKALRPRLHTEMDTLEDATLVKVFCYLMHSDDTTPFPSNEEYRYEAKFIELCHERDIKIGKRHELTRFSGPVDINAFAFFQLQANGVVLYQPTSEKIQLPSIAEAEWSLTDPFSLSCKAECAAMEGLSVDLQAQLASTVAPTGAAWEYNEAAPDDSSIVTTSASSSVVCATPPAKKQKRQATPLSPAVVPGAKKASKPKTT